MKRSLLLLLLVCGLAIMAIPSRAAVRNTPAPYRVGRSVVLAPHGMVATSHPLAAQIGLDVLKKGGNAVDAAIAVNAALGLMEPMSCGVGGDLYAIVWDAKTKKLHGLNASGRSPYRATRQFFADKKLEQIPTTGPLSWSVPGCVDGWEELSKKFGILKLADVLEPTIRYAEDGFPVTEVIAGYWRGAERLAAGSPDLARTYLIEGKAPHSGEVFKNPNLARTYRDIARNGRDAFYKGRIAREIAAFSEKNGGLFALKDFADHTSTWVEPVSTLYRGCEVWEIPPPGQGIAALQMLNVLEGYDLKKMGPDSADYWHLFIEAKKLAYADRARFYADPDFGKLPVKELISKRYADQRRKLIDANKALTNVDHGDPKLGQSDTVYLCVVDKDRNCVSLDPEQLPRFRLGPGSRRSGLRPAESRHALRLDRGPSQSAGAAQTALPHDHPGVGDARGQALVRLRRHGRRHAAAGTRAGAVQPDRLWHERPGGGRGPAHGACGLGHADGEEGPGRRQGDTRTRYLRESDCGVRCAAATSSARPGSMVAAIRASSSTRKPTCSTGVPRHAKTAARWDISRPHANRGAQAKPQAEDRTPLAA